MEMLPLNDPRWSDLDHRNWSKGKGPDGDPDAPFVLDELAQLLQNPTDIERFHNLWPNLCSEGTAWAAAYGAVPYAVELASRVPLEKRFEYLFFVGLVVICSCPECGSEFEIKPYLAKGYQQARSKALQLLTETLTINHNATETRLLLAAVAALKGHAKLGTALNRMEFINQECPACGECVWPEELQQIVNNEADGTE